MYLSNIIKYEEPTDLWTAYSVNISSKQNKCSIHYTYTYHGAVIQRKTIIAMITGSISNPGSDYIKCFNSYWKFYRFFWLLIFITLHCVLKIEQKVWDGLLILSYICLPWNVGKSVDYRYNYCRLLFLRKNINEHTTYTNNIFFQRNVLMKRNTVIFF